MPIRLIIGFTVGAALLTGCGGGDDDDASITTTAGPTTTAATTTTAADCPGDFTMPLDVEVDDECLSVFIRAAADQNGPVLTDDAETQATALCREIGISGFIGATASAFLAWDEGSRPSPADDAPGFVALAIGIYCPEYFNELQDLNG